MTDPRRPSLIDEMALAAALEVDLEVASNENEDLDDDSTDGDEGDELLMEDPTEMRGDLPRMIFNTTLLDDAHPNSVEAERIQRRPSRESRFLDPLSRANINRNTVMNTEEAILGTVEAEESNPDPSSEEADAFTDASQLSSIHMSGSSELFETEDLSGEANSSTTSRKPSVKQQQRTSFHSQGSMQSAPPRTGSGMRHMSLAASKRRISYSIRRPASGLSASSSFSGDDDASSKSAQTTSSGAAGLRRFSRLPSLGHRRQSSQQSSGPLEDALESLGTHTSNSEWENVAAAATVVAAGSQGAGNIANRDINFAVDDTVLVLLTLLNVTNMEDPKDTFTVAPVNKHGYPQGEGSTEEEKSGPYTFVLATVRHVHFDEDDRYYTVLRADTGTEQRADSGWMEPLRNFSAIEAASRAAKRTVRSAQDKPEEESKEGGYLKDVWGGFIDSISWPADFGRSVLIPFYRKQRTNAKKVVAQALYGDDPFSCNVRVTGINFVALCSFVFLFLEVINLSFFPASYDRGMAIVGVIVWSILVLELIFEILIRPANYQELIVSDKAFAPSTARHINVFHILFEAIALATFIPEFECLKDSDVCDRSSPFSRVKASIDSVIGNTHADLARGRFVIGLTVLRLFGVVRHLKQMFITNTFRSARRDGSEKWQIRRDSHSDSFSPKKRNSSKRYDDDSFRMLGDENTTKLTSSEEDQRLKNAATIGTALTVVNSQRSLVLLTAIVLVLPMLQALGQQNYVATNLVSLLQANNIAAPSSSEDDCSYLKSSIESWLLVAAAPQPASLFEMTDDAFVLWAQVLPVRCDFQQADGIITFCSGSLSQLQDSRVCEVWENSPDPEDATPEYFAAELDLRASAIRRKVSSNDTYPQFETVVLFNENPTVALVNMGDLILLFGVLLLGLYILSQLRAEAIRLVLDPLQRMLKIVLRYAENPLSQNVKGGSNENDDDSAIDVDAKEVGNYETEQLINAITKIADLLRKCWGVAGAGIISSNLARTKDGKTVVFNPTVPGKRVYALFGFVAINGLSEQLRALDKDVMILINDVAKVVHDEVYRWALGDHGQCNKNLGAAFLMVFRIGDFSEVQKKKQVATEKLFHNAKTSLKKNANLRRRLKNKMGRSPHGRKGWRNQDVDGQLQLASLPGIQSFTDRALLGMLKSFAGVHRDKSLTTTWKTDFRLTAGVGDYNVDIIYGMDAGWAVEGAVGSEYKIDATYLSPHVNMASRMMSATKQYGVTILLSKAVEELLSRTCRNKLRHLDTVYVKGSKVKQEIFTFDARFRGVDFFLLERTPEQADLDAELYNPNIWDHDQDLRAMRQHVSEEFMEAFHLGVKQYLSGKWEEAYKTFEKANDLMMEKVLEDGYLEYDLEELEGRLFEKKDQEEDIVRVRHELGDGASRVLMAYMERRGLKAPDDWDAVRQLYSK